MQSVIFGQEEAKYDVANTGAFAIGLGMCIPTLMAYGSKESIARYVKPALRGDEIWCQLFSEPAGGSDVAALRTRAEKDGDDWVINGSKVWTTGAQFSDYGLLLARTDPTVPKHKGLTMFYLSMKQPGVEVRPIIQSSGDSGFK
jgi:alkylation response protein AidB-like acyl-CoA dehydrogenase